MKKVAYFMIIISIKDQDWEDKLNSNILRNLRIIQELLQQKEMNKDLTSKEE